MFDELIDRLQNRRTLILGVGDPLRGDDRLGPAPIKRFPREVGAVLIEAGGRLCTSGGSNLETWRRRVSLGIGGVWEDVRSLLAEPGRVEAEYRRRLEGRGPEGGPRAESLGELIRAAKRRITRLIDAYEGGLMDKGEFEPRVVRARERLSQLEAESRIEEERQTAEQELRLVIGQLEAFGQRVSGGLSEADWPTMARSRSGWATRTVPWGDSRS